MDGRFFVEWMPLSLTLAMWVGLLLLIYLLFLRSKSPAAVLGPIALSQLQNSIYKRFAMWLLFLGAVGGFLPSLLIILQRGHVWSVNHQSPHTLVDLYLIIHIPLSFLWAGFAALQVWSGQVAHRRQLHQSIGKAALVCGIMGVGLFGGIAWPIVNDFNEGLTGPSVGAGLYTIIVGFGVIINGFLAIHCVKIGDLAGHKDHAMMMLFWTLDPGLHRLAMWLMRLFGDSTWAPENTNGLGIAIAKLPANMTLIFGSLAMAVLARRLNSVIWSNVGGQFVLWCLGSALLVNGYQGTEFAVATSLISVLLFFAALTWTVKSNMPANG